MRNKAGGHGPRSQPSALCYWVSWSAWGDRTFGCLKALSSLLDVELDRLPFLQRLHAAALQRSDVNEHVLALLGLDEAVAPPTAS
jgi:hypothetical protein